MKNMCDVFLPLKGGVVWGVKKVHGSIVNMQFGEPHLWIREPVIPSSNSSQKVKENLRRRRVFVVGQWQFCIQDGEWEIIAGSYKINNIEVRQEMIDECLGELDGQKLISAQEDTEKHSIMLDFDFGASVRIWPSPTMPREVEQWNLHIWGGDTILYRNDGTCVLAEGK